MNIIAGTDSDGFLARRGAPLRPPLVSLSFGNHRILHAVKPAMELDARLMAIIDEGKSLPCDDRLESELLAVVDQVKPNVWTILSPQGLCQRRSRGFGTYRGAGGSSGFPHQGPGGAGCGKHGGGFGWVCTFS